MDNPPTSSGTASSRHSAAEDYSAPAGSLPVAVRLPVFLGDFLTCLPALELLRSAGVDCRLVGEQRLKVFCDALGYPLTVVDGSDATEVYRSLGVRHGISFRVSSIRSNVDMARAGLRPLSLAPFVRQLLMRRTPWNRACGSKVDVVYGFARSATRSLGREIPAAASSIPFVELPIDTAWQEEADRRLSDAGIHGPFVVCNPVAATQGHPEGWREWPAFPDAIRRLGDDHGIRVVVCPGPGEEERAHRAAPSATVMERIRLPELSAVFRRSALVLSNDSGPMHLAATVGVPTVGVFGHTSPDDWAPHGRRAVVAGAKGEWPGLDVVFRQIRTVSPGLV